MSQVNYGRGYVYSLQYHVVWYVKYRHKVLTEKIENRLKEILLKIAEDNNFKIILMNGNLDHIHLLIECTPQNYIPDMLKALKGVRCKTAYERIWFRIKTKTIWWTFMESVLFCCNC